MFNPYMQELKEPLISIDELNKLESNFLYSYNADIAEGKDKRSRKPYKGEEAESKDHAPNQHLDFYELNKDLFNEASRQDESLNSNTWDQYKTLSQRKKRPVREEERYAFFKQATAQHDLPTTQIMRISYMKTDPTLFAVMSRASKFFQDPELYLKEIICLQDYKNLSKIRVRNYIYILRMLTNINKSEALKLQVKRKLLQIKKLCEYLELLEEENEGDEENEEEEGSEENKEDKSKEGESQANEEASEKAGGSEKSDKKKPKRGRPLKINQIQSVFQRLKKGIQIYDLEDHIQEPSKKDKRFQDYKAYEAQSEDSEEEESDEYNSEEEDEEDESDGEQTDYNNYFSESQFLDGNDYAYEQHLMIEESKWANRSEWLIAQLFQLKNGDEEMQAWVPWFEAKLEQLQDLDVPGLDSSLKTKMAAQSNVFYLHQFLDNYLAQQRQNSQTNDEDAFLNDKYSPEQMVYIEEQNMYPKVKIDMKDAPNSNHSMVDVNSNIREKLCLKVLFREAHTDYFLTVFRRRQFGNEKVYEKRINLNGRVMDIKQMEFQPSKGQFLYLSFQIQKPYEDAGSDDEDEATFENQIDMIFPLEAKFKDPLLVKPKREMKILGFYGDKNFYSYQQIEVKEKKISNADRNKQQQDQEGDNPNVEEEEETHPTAGAEGEADAEHKHEEGEEKHDDKSKDDEDEGKSRWVYRVYEYDLHNFQRIRVQDLPFYKESTVESEFEKKFGKNKDSFQIVFKAPFEVKNDKNKQTANKDEYQYIIMRGREEYSLQLTNKRFRFKTEKIKDKTENKYQEEFWFNGKGDKILLKYKVDDQIMLVRLVLDAKNKLFKQDLFEFKNIKEFLEADSKIKVKSDLNDFVIMVKATGNQQEFNIYLNDKFVTKTAATEENLHFNIQEGQINSIYEFNEQANYMQVLAQKFNKFAYKSWERGQSLSGVSQTDIKQEWQVVDHDIINHFQCVNFPNAFFIYNHDQLYMKDLSVYGNEGYYYLNNYLGITEKHRPLTVHCFSYWNIMAINIPIIETKYYSSQFELRVHSLVTSHCMTNPYVIPNTFLRHQVYGFNQHMSASLGVWSRAITNSEGLLDNDIRVTSVGAALRIEKWEKGRCIHRVIVTHYNQNKDPQLRDVTDVVKMSNDQTTKDKSITYREESYKLIIIQKPEGISTFVIDMAQTEEQEFEFENQNMLESIFDYTDEEQSNPIVDIMVDSLVSNRLDIYIVHQNLEMKRFSASIKEGVNNGQPKFEEHSTSYDLTPTYQDKPSGKANSQGGKKLKRYTSFIANAVLYTQSTVLDLIQAKDCLMINKAVDLTAEIIENKLLVGNQVQSPFNEKKFSVDYRTFSPNETRLICIATRLSEIITEKEGGVFYEPKSYTRLVKKIVVTNLFNSRTIPQFFNQRFRNPVVPLLNTEKGFTSVFTLHLDNKLASQFSSYENDSAEECVNHQNQHFMLISGEQNLQPGIIVKYFNGIEKRYPIADRFLDIKKLIVSKDGTSVVLSGMLFAIKDNLVTLKDGLHLYRINEHNLTNLALDESFFYAVKQSSDSEKKIERTKLIDTEINEHRLGNYGLTHILSYQSSPNAVYHQELMILDQSDDEEEVAIVPVAKPVEVVRNKNKTQKFKDLYCETEGFDIPSYYCREWQLEELFNTVQENFDVSLIPGVDLTKEVEYEFVMDVCQNTQYPFEEDEKQEEDEVSKMIKRIDSINENMHIFVNDNGQIILLNRVNDTIYLFYNEDGNNQPKVYKHRIEKENFGLQGAECSGDYLVVWGLKSFKVFDISKLLEFQHQNQNAKKQMVEVDISTFSFAIRKIRRELDSKKKLIGQNNEKIEQDDLDVEYTYDILDVRLIGEKVIVKTKEDEDTRYIQIYDFKKKVMLNYIEYDQAMISGCNQYIWLPLKNKVYDINSNFSTLFMWPTTGINTGPYDSMDMYNISEDRTIMASQGVLYLTFDIISAQHDQLNLNDIFETKKFQSLSNQLFYKLQSQNSIIDRILKAQFNVFSSSMKSSQKVQDHTVENQSEQQIQLLKYVNFLNSSVNTSQQIDDRKITEYLLSYFCEDNSQPAYTSMSEPDFKNSTTAYWGANYMNIIEVLFEHVSPRNDIINEVLRFFVKNVDIPIIQSAVNKSFLKLLSNADQSQPFQDYLQNIILKTSKMEITDKFAIASSNQGYKIGTYSSPIIDDGFNIKFIDKVNNQIETKKEVQVQYVFLGALLEEQGQEIMKELSDPKFQDIMSIPFIKYLVKIQWENVRKDITQKTLYPFYALLGLFSLFTIRYVNFADFNENKEPVTDSLEHLNVGEQVQYEILFILQLIVLIYFFRIEVRQFMIDPKNYISSIWNMADVVSYSLCMMVLIMEATNISKFTERPIACLALIILWCKLFYFLRVYDSTAQLIRMIIEIVNDMKNFLIVLLIGIIGFTGGLYILQQGLDNRQLEDPGNDRFVGDNFVKAFIYTFRMTLGDFQLDAMSEMESQGLYFDFYFVWSIFIIGSMFLVIILLNLLIAIMGSTFERVMEAIVNLNLREKVLLVSENENLFDRKSLFKGSQYLIIISEKVQDSSEEDTQIQHINSLKEQLVGQVSSLENELKSQMADSKKEIKRQFLALEEMQKKNTDIKGGDKDVLKESVAKINEMFATQQTQIAQLQQHLIQASSSDGKTSTSVQEQILKLQGDQQQFTTALYKHLNIEAPKN